MAAIRRPSATSWKTGTIKREETINKELTMKINNRRRMSTRVYGDLNFLLVNKDRLAKLSASKEEGCVATSKLIIKPKEITEATEIALMTGCRCFGTHNGASIKDKVLEFVQKIFKLTGQNIEDAQNQASQEPPPKLFLMCRVIKATELKSKDNNGTNHHNPYCRLGIVGKNHLESSSDFKFLTEWQKVGAVKEVSTTSSKQATAEPEWNEDIKLSIENIEEDVMIVEVWDDVHLDKGSKKNLRALISHGKEEFMSWMSQQLCQIPISGEESSYTLTSRSKKTQKGTLTLFLRIQADTDKQLEVSLREHRILTRAMIDECSKDDDGKNHIWNWSGQLCSDSEKLLEIHGSLHGLSKLQLISIRLSELLRYHRRLYGVEIKSFLGLILQVKDLEKKFMSLSHTSFIPPVRTTSPVRQALHQIIRVVSPDQQSTPQWEQELFSELNKLESELVETLNDHIRLVQFGYDGDVKNIISLLSALKELDSIETYIQWAVPKKSFKDHLESCIVPSVKDWFSLLMKRVMPTGGSEQRELRDLCSHCLIWTEKVQELLHPKCMELARVDYFSHYLVELDTLLSHEVIKCLESYKQQTVETYTFEVYTTFQRFVELSQMIGEDDREKLSFLHFHNWFEEFVSGWIKLSREKCESRIEQAIQLDEIVKVTEDLSLSSSAVDTKGFLHQMAAFWQHVDWPVASEAYGYAVFMIENMCCCAELYVGKIFASLSSESLRDKQGRFKVSEKLCLVLNNMYHVREFLAELSVHMDLNNFYARLEQEDKMIDSLESGGSNQGTSLAIRAKKLIGNFVTNADEEILKKIDDVARKICNKLSPDILAFVTTLVKRKKDESASKLINPLFEYLTENLTTLGNHLLPSVFESITATLWEVSVGVIEQLSSIPRRKDLTLHQNLLDALMSLRDFYYCEGEGVSGRALDSDAYLTLHSKLSFVHLTTNQLIVDFYSGLVRLQQEEAGSGNVFGELVVSVGYIKEMSAIEVNVIQARDTEMLQDPYVKLRLSSVCKSADQHWKTKPVKGGIKAPSFSEEFNLPSTEEEMRLEGSLVLFYLLDKQHKGKSYIGMCAVACRDIPHLSQASLKMSISNPYAPQRRNFSLPLFQFTTETPALSELIARADIKDVNATKFMKSNELLLSCTSNDNNRNRSKST